MHKKKIIAIIETSYVVRKGLSYSLMQLSGIEKVVELDTTTELDTQIKSLAPDIVIVNPIAIGATSLQNPHEILNFPKTKPIIALCYSPLEQKTLQNFDAQINIMDSFDTIAEKMKVAIADNRRNGTETVEELSEREKEILVTLAKGLSNKEIADHFNLSIHTVIAHRRNITRKLDIYSVSGLTVYAIINKLVDLHDISVI